MRVAGLQTKINDGNIYLQLLENEDSLSMEEYELVITSQDVKITASHAAGLFRGVQTLLQLFPAQIESPIVEQGPWKIATGIIRDYPEYEYRGSMLDVSRHFFSVDDVKKYIDYLSAYKMNVLHLHLSDDQGWRIEIKSWPKLTEIGGSTEVDGGEGGFYTQEEFKDIVRYAAARYITIVPEIEVPGHSNAILASYPELNCDGKARELYTGTEVGFSTVCTQKDVTYEFVDDVIRELSEISPGPYIHIGGDESLITEKDDYIYFINKVEEIVLSHGKKMIGWEEIAQTELDSSSTVQFWVNEEHAMESLNRGVKLLMSPAKRIYMDMQYDSTSPLGLHWAAYIEVDDAYNWDPAEYVEGVTRDHIIGIEAPLWSETLETIDDIEYMMFPRMPGYAEIGWTPKSGRNWESYKVRLAEHGKRFEAMDINFYRSAKIDW